MSLTLFTFSCKFHDRLLDKQCTKRYKTQSALNKHIRASHDPCHPKGTPGPPKDPNHKEVTKTRSKKYRTTNSILVRRKENRKNWLINGVEKAKNLNDKSVHNLTICIGIKTKELFMELSKFPCADKIPFLHATLVSLILVEVQYNFNSQNFVDTLRHLFGEGFYTVLNFETLEKEEEFGWVVGKIYSKRSLVSALGSIVKDVVARTYFFNKERLFKYNAQKVIIFL